jgi:putative endonuclease
MTISAKRRLGNIGESVAAEFLTKHGFTVLDRNYLKKWGELDIVAKKGNIIHFIEVKSVSRKTSDWDTGSSSLNSPGKYRPEENVHPEKLKRLARTMQTYLLEKRLDDQDWQLDIMTALIDEDKKKARVEIIENIII